MGAALLVSALSILIGVTSSADEPLRSLPLNVPGLSVLVPQTPANFDLVDLRDEARARAASHVDVAPHSIFGIKHHIGGGVGYDNGVPHASVGLYITVAEWGRWNFGVPSPALGIGHYHEYDAKQKRAFMKSETSIFVSLASVHFRAGHVRPLGLNWYVDLEQVFDTHHNQPGSQVGLSFSRK